MADSGEVRIDLSEAQAAANQMSAAAGQIGDAWSAHQAEIAAAAEILNGDGDTAKALRDLYNQYAPNNGQIIQATTDGARTLADNAGTVVGNFDAVDGDQAHQFRQT